MSILETENLDQRFGEHVVLSDVNLKIESSEVFVLIGPTGAGKTTLLRLLDLLDRPVSGRVYFDGTDVTVSKSYRQAARRRMSYVQQKPLVFNMNVYDNIACGLRWRQESEDAVRRKVDNIMRLVGMQDYRDRKAKTLSGGETQRVALARALVTDPEVLFLDEPTANLDPISVSKVEEVLNNIANDDHTTLIMATHDMSQGQRLADRIGVMVNGRLVQVGKPREVFIAPQTKEVAEFVGVENILPGIVVSRDSDLVSIDVHQNIIESVSAHQPGEKVFVLIRPEDITLILEPGLSSARNIFMGKIIKMISMEPLIRIEIDCGFPLLVLVTRRSSEEMGLAIGKSVYCSLKASAIRVIKRW
ncbi:MAG: ABC transporter ATP-binding protein [Dehalococcoidales bacterium]|nr:ABC transporter ATP-binding protein [Dehalococcoidales bacterium]